MEKEASGCCASVDGIGQVSELNSLLVELSDHAYQILHTSAEPIQFPDDEGVAFA